MPPPRIVQLTQNKPKQFNHGSDKKTRRAGRCAENKHNSNTIQQLQKKITSKIINQNLPSKQPESFKKPLYHLRGRQMMKYIHQPTENNDKPQDDFSIDLELFNRHSVCAVQKPCGTLKRLSSYFYKCIGRSNTSMKLCTVCRDVEKEWQSTDCYYMDFAEITRERTVLCRGCMANLISLCVPPTLCGIQTELEQVRMAQPEGVYVDPFLITCGY